MPNAVMYLLEPKWTIRKISFPHNLYLKIQTKLNVVDVESHLRYNDSMRDTKHLESFARQREKEKRKNSF